MLKIENVITPSAAQIEAVIRGMRNPKNSWEKSDSGWVADEKQKDSFDYFYDEDENYPDRVFQIGSNDHKLMMQLAGAGPVHGKFRRMIPVYLDITAPLYWWKEFDTYKVGTVANSCSTMHKIQAKEFTLDDFSHEHLFGRGISDLKTLIHDLNTYRDLFNYGGSILYDPSGNTAIDFEPGNKDIWWQMIQLLPTSYNQKRTVMLNYEVLSNIYRYRRNHKLDEWRTFCSWIKTLPYSEIVYADILKEG